jgi:hypothetical protein
MKRLAAVTCFVILAFVPRPGAAQSKPVLIGVKVEAEGGGESQGMWTQAATDLTSKELKTLESLVVAEMKKQNGVKIDPMTIRRITSASLSSLPKVVLHCQ